MTTLSVEKLTMPAAELGPENPLPYFRASNPDAKYKLDDSISEEDRKHMGWQSAFRVLPHRMQDSYNRELKPRDYVSIILENEHLRASFIPELGGRLASLIHKRSGLELLEPVTHFQPANVALRNAWIAGGVEWNTAQLGHHYLTCAPMFAARIAGAYGESSLRFYAWERTKQFPYQLDFHLPPDSEFLYVRVKIINPHKSVLPMYWWSNIAVPQTPDRRVLAPTDRAVTNAPDGFAMVDLPIVEGIDVSYPTNVQSSREYFFRIDDSQRPWAAALDESGRGLIHTSTQRLLGRKMFVWGTGRGGQRWQEYLLGGDRAYIEIQGGLARTQLETIPMPADTQWTWTEAYGLMSIDPAAAHSPDWIAARTSVDEALNTILPAAELNDLDAKFAEISNKAPLNVLLAGDGWGSLESILNPCIQFPEMPFGENFITPQQQPWLSLLRNGYLPECSPEEGPGHFMVQSEWRKLLEESIELGKSDHWLGHLHLGIMKREAFDVDGARESWLKSIEHTPTSWAYRNLSALPSNDDDTACDYMAKAWSVGPRVTALALEYAHLLEKHERWDELKSLIEELPEDMRNHERMLIVAARIALHFDDLSKLEEILSHDFASIREGEVTLTDLWFAWQAKLIARKEGIAVDDALLVRVRQELTPPWRIDQRTY